MTVPQAAAVLTIFLHRLRNVSHAEFIEALRVLVGRWKEMKAR